MNNNVQHALKAAIMQFGKVRGCTLTEFTKTIVEVFELDNPYLEKVACLDEIFDEKPTYESLREVLFDLLLVNFFTEDMNKLEEDYLESKEWQLIEEETLERGTELLNILLYLKECEDEGLQPGLEDYLKEFLLVDEDEFQDEYRIYEDVIANQLLVHASVDEIAQAAHNLPTLSEFKDLFYPVICFFRNLKPSEAEFDFFVKHSENPEFDAAVYAVLTAYNQPNQLLNNN